MDERCRADIVAEDVVDIIVEYDGRLDSLKELYEPLCIYPIDEKYAIMYFRYTNMQTERYSNNLFPKLYGPLAETVNNKTNPMEKDREENLKGMLDTSGILLIRERKNFELRGGGVLIGIVDTGIDYYNKCFLRDGESCIKALWDQADQTGELPVGFMYGSEYSFGDDIENNAVPDKLNNPEGVYETSHGTAMAQLALEVAPDADIIAVKLKPAKKYLMDYNYVTASKECFQENDIILGIKYIVNKARELNRPVVICLGLGTNNGGHDGSSILDEYISTIGNTNNICMITAAGNEGSSAGHFHGEFTGTRIDSSLSRYGNSMVEDGKYIDENRLICELKSGAGETGFMAELWRISPANYDIEIISPSGESAYIMGRYSRSQVVNFLFEETIIYVDSYGYEVRTGDPYMAFRFERPVEGIWKIIIHDEQGVGGVCDIWLPIKQFLDGDTRFLKPDPDTTITDPGNGILPITVTAYNSYTGSLYDKASRGYNRYGAFTPDIAAPGVNIPINLRFFDEYKTEYFSGSSLAAAFCAGAAALVMEWAGVKGNLLPVSTRTVKKIMYSGAKGRKGLPNNVWGYGFLNLYQSFLNMRY